MSRLVPNTGSLYGSVLVAKGCADVGIPADRFAALNALLLVSKCSLLGWPGPSNSIPPLGPRGCREPADVGGTPPRLVATSTLSSAGAGSKAVASALPSTLSFLDPRSTSLRFPPVVGSLIPSVSLPSGARPSETLSLPGVVTSP